MWDPVVCLEWASYVHSGMIEDAIRADQSSFDMPGVSGEARVELLDRECLLEEECTLTVEAICALVS